ncbi:MAG TPA: ribonuclease P protein component [Candidatus Onthoplasma faecipullorum]|nr:ribonuclease P protein component [Candidatus Onthoplasma faecipullorum]
MLSKENRLKKKKEFNYIYKRGEVFHSHSFTMHVVRAYKRFPQIGISVSKAVGNSVVRSRVKRIFSEACRLNINRFAVKNYVITPKPISATKTSTEIARELMSVLNKNGLYRDV